jgi:4-methoxybenzoate monooxygenase (O-demethylating)
MAGVLSPLAVRELRADFRSAAEELADRLVARGTFDAVSDVAEVYPLKVFPDAVGLPEDGRENLLPYGALAFNAFGPHNDLLEAALETATPVQEWTGEANRNWGQEFA